MITCRGLRWSRSRSSRKQRGCRTWPEPAAATKMTMIKTFTFAHRRDCMKSVWRDHPIVTHLDNAIVDHMVSHDRSISRNVPKRPNGLMIRINIENLMNSRNILVISNKNEAPKQPEKQNIGEREFRGPRIMGEMISTENKLWVPWMIWCQRSCPSPARRHCGQDSAAASRNGAARNYSAGVHHSLQEKNADFVKAWNLLRIGIKLT